MASFYYYCPNCVEEKGVALASGNWAYFMFSWMHDGDERANCRFCGRKLAAMDSGLERHLESIKSGRKALKQSLAMGRTS